MLQTAKVSSFVNLVLKSHGSRCTTCVRLHVRCLSNGCPQSSVQFQASLRMTTLLTWLRHRVVTAEDYALILGLPGTGKTSTITRAAMALLAAGKSVLVSSYTNSAVDNILLKLASLGAPLLRLGRLEGIHPAMRPYALGGTHYPDTSASSLQRIARDARLVLSHMLLHDTHGRPTQQKAVR